MDNSIIDTVVLKCEPQKSKEDFTGNTCKTHDLLLSVATTYSYKDGVYKFWTFNNKDDLCKYLDNKKIICFNGCKFDFPLLFGETFKNDPTYLINLNGKYCFYIIDILFQIFHSIYHVETYERVIEKLAKNPVTNMNSYSLYNVYNATINKPKPVIKDKSADLYKTKKILELVEFNLLKLCMIKELYEFIQNNGYIVNGDYDVVKVNLINHNCNDADLFLPF